MYCPTAVANLRPNPRHTHKQGDEKVRVAEGDIYLSSTSTE